MAPRYPRRLISGRPPAGRAPFDKAWLEMASLAIAPLAIAPLAIASLAIASIAMLAGCDDTPTDGAADDPALDRGADAVADGGVDAVRDGGPGPQPPDATLPDAIAYDAMPDAAAPDMDVAPDIPCPAPTPADVDSITFYAMGDPQYGGGADDKNTFHIEALNRFRAVWPEGLPSAGEPVDPPLGLMIAGDLTQNGRDGRLTNGILYDEIGAFVAEYGLRGGDGLLDMPVYEGYGNHEFDPDEPYDPEDIHHWRSHYTEDPTPSVDVVATRNARRCHLTRVAPDRDGHYSWDWGPVHFVNADLFPGDAPSDADETSRVRDPRRALTFLREDLAAEVGDSGRPVIVMAHYGFDAFGHEPRWWNDAQKAEFMAAIEGYNVIAYIHGHTHATYQYTWQGLDVFNVGSPYYTNYNQDRKGHFTVFRITRTHLEAHDVGWSPAEEGRDPHWTGWSFSKAIRVPD